MLTDDQLAEVRRLPEKQANEWISYDIYLVWMLLPAFLIERDLLVAVAEQAERQQMLQRMPLSNGVERTLAAWRAARDGVPATGGETT